MNEPVLYDVNDIQRIFKMRRTKAYELMRSDFFPTIKIGKTRYITAEALNDFLCKNKGREISL